MTNQLSHLLATAGLGMLSARARALAPSSRLVRTPGGTFGGGLSAVAGSMW